MSTIVVGVDGSPQGDVALAWALREARSLAAAGAGAPPVRAVLAWDLSWMDGPEGVWAAASARDTLAAREAEGLAALVGDAGARVVAGTDRGRDEPLGLQRADPLPDRRPAHAQLHGQVALGREVRTDPQRAGEDAGLDVVHDGLVGLHVGHCRSRVDRSWRCSPCKWSDHTS